MNRIKILPLILLGLGVHPAHGAMARTAVVRTSVTGYSPLAAPLVVNPANLGGIALSLGNPLQAPSLTTPLLTPGVSLGSPLVAPVLTPAQVAVPAAEMPVTGALGSVQSLDASLNTPNATPSDIHAASNLAFDGSSLHAPSITPGDTNGGVEAGADNTLGKLYPRVVMILDTLNGPASDKLVAHIETLVQNGVHVVFVTARPEKGENSADSVLVGRLKVRTQNPVVVVSYNGARITARSSRAENPKPLIDDEPGFAQNTIEKFRKIDAAVKVKLGVKGAGAEFGIPSAENALIYGSDLPKGVDAAAWKAAYNTSLRNAGLKYKIEVGTREDGTSFYYTQSTALKLNTARIFNGLYSQYPELKQDLKNSEILILADSTKAANFLKSLPGNGYYIHGVKDGATMETAVAAVLGHSALEKVSVIRSQLRSYTEWLEARAKWGTPKSFGSGGGGGGRMPASHSRYYRDLGFFRGILLYDIMGRLYHFMRKGQYAEASPEAAEELLTRMWYNPRANGVRISDDMEAVRHTPRWKALQRGYLETSKVWLRNYYKRNFKDYPNGVSEKVVGTMINLSRDSKNAISLEYLSPYTGRRYTVHLLPARAHLERDDKGNLLVAHVYRSGKEPFEEEFEDSIEQNLLARAMLQGYADKRVDGKWYVNDEADPRVKVIFHYNTRDLSRIQTVAEVESHSADVTALIEKMNADKEFIAHWEEQEAKNNKVTAGAAKKKADKTKKADGKKKKKS